MIFRSSVLLIIFLLIMSYISFENAEKLFSEDAKERFGYSWKESERIKDAICKRLQLNCSDQKVTNIIMPPETLAEYTEGIVYKDVEYGFQEEQKLNIIIPLSIRAREKLPVFVFIHGGTWMAGTKDSIIYSQFAKEIIKNRCIFVTINYRLYPKVRFPEILDDPAKALTWVFENISLYGGDPNQIILSGHSAGAHLASLLISKNSPLPKEVYLSVKKAFLFSGPYDLPEYDASFDIKYKEVVKGVFLYLFGGRNNLQNISPVYVAQKTHIDYLLVVGEKDEVTPPEQSEKYYQALKDKKNKVDLFILPNTGHGGTVFYLNSDFGFKTQLPVVARKFLEK